jgi:sec-independent protein translocase protein TatC
VARTLNSPTLNSVPAKLPAPRPHLPAKLTSRLPKLPDPNEPDVFEEMTLLEHMEELRDRIIKCVIAIGLAFIAGLVLVGPLITRVQEEANAKQGFYIISPTDPFTIYFKVALYIAIGIASPVLLWEIIGFLLPGLTKKEKRFLLLSLPFVLVLFLLGAAYAFFFAAPQGLRFLSSFMSNAFMWSPQGNETFNFFLMLMLGMGVAFQLPVVMFVLAKLGLVSPQRMRSWWRYAVVILLVLAAVITPSTDAFNMMVVFVPLYLLYEIGILVSRLFAKRPLVSGARAEAPS